MWILRSDLILNLETHRGHWLNVNFVHLTNLSQETTLKMQKELSENESKDFFDSIKDSTDVTLAADDDKEILEDSVENVDAGDVKTEPDELQTPGQI